VAPHSPRRSGRPGTAVAPLFIGMGGPDMAPHSPRRSGHPGTAVAPLFIGLYSLLASFEI